jgi:hypothetical protein
VGEPRARAAPPVHPPRAGRERRAAPRGALRPGGSGREPHAEGCQHQAGHLEGRERIAEHRVIDHRGHGRHQEEQRRDLVQRPAAQQHEQQREGGERVDPDHPAEACEEHHGAVESESLVQGQGQEQQSGHQLLQRQAAARIDVRAVTLLVQRAGADADEADEHREVGAEAGAGAVTRAEALADRKRDAADAEREPEPLQRAHRLFENREPEERRDDRHRADDERDQSDVHPARGCEVQGAELQCERQRTDHRTVQGRPPARPGHAAKPGERAEDQSRGAEAQDEECKGGAVIEREPCRRIPGAPQDDERDAEHPSRDGRESRGRRGGRGESRG